MSEIDRFLTPIADDNPSGVDLRLSSGDLTFSELDELRREADPLLDPGGETKNADWRGVRDLCETSLIQKTKDLELATMYGQALVHLEGLPGLATCLRLLTGLVGTFWDHLYPGLDEGEIVLAIRARPLSWVGTSKEFLNSVGRAPLSAPIGENSRSWFDLEQAKRVDNASIKADQAEFQELIEAGLISSEQWHASLAATPPERVATTTDQIHECQVALQELSALCDEKFGDEAPYFTDLANLLDEIHSQLSQFLVDGGAAMQSSETGAAESTEGSAPVGNPTSAPAGTPVAVAPSGPVVSRDDAYRKLREVAEYLRKTEPHSPVPPLIDRAIRWGNMTFENLFDDVVKNQDVRNQTKEMLGLEDPPM